MGVLEGSDCFRLSCVGQSFVFWYESRQISVFAEEGMKYFVAISLPRHGMVSGGFVLSVEVSPSEIAKRFAFGWSIIVLPEYVSFHALDQESASCPTRPENDSCETAEDVGNLPASFSEYLNLASSTGGGQQPSGPPTSYYYGDDGYYYGDEKEDGDYEDYHEENLDVHNCYVYGRTQMTWYRIETIGKACCKW